MTSTSVHANGDRLDVVARADTPDVKPNSSGRSPQSRIVVGLATLALRHPLVVDALLLLPAMLLVSGRASIVSLHPLVVALGATAVTVNVARWVGVYSVAAADARNTASRRVAQTISLCVAGFLLLAYVTEFAHDRTWLPLAAGAGFSVLLAHRLVARWLSAHPAVLPHIASRLALLGDADAIAEFDKIERRDPRRVVVQRTVLDTYDDIRPALRKVDKLIGQVHRGEVDRVVVLATAPGIPVVNAVVRRCSMRGVGVDLLTGATGVRPSRLEMGRLHGFATVHIRSGLHGRSRVRLKRVFDMIVAAIALVVLSPLMVAAAVAVKLGSRGPVFYKQRRLGRGGRQFEMIKFRSMLPDADQMIVDLTDENEADGPLFKMKNDPRITRVGGILRRTSMDELPQLWNVVRGQMSLVGPRPALAIEADSWPIELFDRLEVPPGITGLWQVNGRSDASFADYARLDLYYVDNWTISLDLQILARTLPALLGRGAY